MFEKVLRAFETRGITYSDVLARLRRLLATGASPTELLAILRRRESTERMPEYARLEALLIEAVEQSAVDDEDSGQAQPRDPMTADPRGSHRDLVRHVAAKSLHGDRRGRAAAAGE